MTNEEYFDQLNQDKAESRRFRENTSVEQMALFLSKVDFNFLKNAHTSALLFLLKNGKSNIFQIKKHFSQKNISHSYGFAYKVVHQLEKKKYITLKKKGHGHREKEISLVTENIFELFGGK